MPQIGWFELLVIVVIAVLVIGPKDFPIVLKKVGSWIGTTKRYISNIQDEMKNLDIETDDTEKPIEKLKDNDKA